jgi:hypothetical protein
MSLFHDSEPSHHFSTGGHLWLACRRIGVKCKHLDHAKALTPEEIHSKAAKRDDPLLDFSSICRRELESPWKGL